MDHPIKGPDEFFAQNIRVLQLVSFSGYFPFWIFSKRFLAAENFIIAQSGLSKPPLPHAVSREYGSGLPFRETPSLPESRSP